MSPHGRSAYSDSEMYSNDKAFVITGSFLKYLCAILNSTFVTWFIKNSALTTGVGFTQWKKFVVERIPILKIPSDDQQSFIHLVDHILQVKDSNHSADISVQEKEIDRLVYSLYNLTAEEISAIEGNKLDGFA